MILEEVVERITGRWAVSLKAWIYLTSLGILGTITRTYTQLGISRKESILLALGITVVTAPIYYLVAQTLLRKRFTETLSVYRVFTSYLIFWLTVGVAEVLITIFIFHKTAYLGPQLFAPLFPDIFGFVASSYLLAEFDKNRTDISRLKYARAALVETAHESRQQVIKERSQLIAAIQDSVFYQLDALKKQFALIRTTSNRQEIERLANELENYSTNTIRNLSHEMANDAGTSNPIDRLIFVGNEKIKNFANAYAPYVSFKLSMAVLLIVGGFHELSLNGFAGFEFQVATTLSIVPVLLIGSLLTRRYSQKNISLGFAIFLVTVFLCGYISVIVSNILVGEDLQLRTAYPATIFAGRTLISIVIASLIVIIVQARRKTLKDLIEMNEKLQVDLEWMDNRSRELRKELASILHGPLQGRIAGIAMALRLSAEDAISSDEEKVKKLQEIETLLATVISDVQELFKVEKNQPEASIVIKLINLRRSWDGIAEISWGIHPDVFAMLPASKFEMVSEILYEAVSNSVRHGGATSVRISFALDSKDLILTVIDNGTGVKSDFTPSAGLHKITEHGARYSFTSGLSRGAELTVRIDLQGLATL